MENKILEEMGLTENEIKVYIALLKLGSTTAGPLTKKSGIHRSRVYEALNRLVEKGLISFVIKENTKYYQAADPQKFKEILEERRKELDKIVPELEKIQKTVIEKQEAFVYEGIKGIGTLLNHAVKILRKNEEYLAFSLGDEHKTKEVQLLFKNQLAKRQEKRIITKIIANKEMKKLVLSLYGKYKGIEYKFTEQITPTGIIIYKDYVATLIWGEKPTAFVIHSKQNAEQYRKFFYDFWKKLKL